MTPQILQWFFGFALPHLQSPGRVLEIGARNVNGSVRGWVEPLAQEYIGTDMQAGEGVNLIIKNQYLYPNFKPDSIDTIICCECLEHDASFWVTLENIREILKPGGHLVITTPTIGFPFHPYPLDLWRFTKDAYQLVFFDSMTILDLQTIDSEAGKDTTICGIAQKKEF